MKLKPVTKHLIGVAVVGMAMSTVASAATFNVTGTVQNALTVAADAGTAGEMHLGTVFATTASSGSYKYMTLAPDGTMGASAGAGSIILLGLGGHQAAGASVAVGNTTAFTVTLPDYAMGTLDGTTTTATGTVVEVAPADPAAARLRLVNFRAGNPTGGTAAAGCATTASCVLTPTFGSTSVHFGIGATIVTDLSGTRTAYQPTSYTGTFAVTATY